MKSVIKRTVGYESKWQSQIDHNKSRSAIKKWVMCLGSWPSNVFLIETFRRVSLFLLVNENSSYRCDDAKNNDSKQPPNCSLGSSGSLWAINML